PCPLSWHQHNRRCYHAFHAHRDWNDAQEQCTRTGGKLATAENEEIAKFLRTIQVNESSPSNSYWIGGSDGAVEGVYRWLDTSLVTFAIWETGEPN
ncbi:hypothetical protein CAPTEDRAFT_77943, partial [Capitella teleta]